MSPEEYKRTLKDWKELYIKEKEKNFRLERDAKRNYEEMDSWVRRGSTAMLALDNLKKSIREAKSLTTLQRSVRDA